MEEAGLLPDLAHWKVWGREASIMLSDLTTFLSNKYLREKAIFKTLTI